MDAVGIERKRQMVMHRRDDRGLDSGNHCGLANRHIKEDQRSETLDHLDDHVEVEISRIVDGGDAAARCATVRQ